MLRKNDPLEIDQNNPFKNDKQDRKNVIKNLTSLIQSTNQSFVISIEAPWGWGKTTLISMLKANLESENHSCLYFNAWNNDFVEDPLIAFLGEMNVLLSKEKLETADNKRIKALLVKAQKLGGTFIRKSLPLAITILSKGIINQAAIKQGAKIYEETLSEISRAASKYAETKIANYEKEKLGIDEFKKNLEEFACELLKSKNRKAPLVIFVDELDRCRPNFAIALLERIKHLFNINGVVFVLSLDKEQLEQSIKSVYGIDMNCDGYIRRFIDYSFRLPPPSIRKYCSYMFDRFHLEEVYKLRGERIRFTPDENPQVLLTAFSELASNLNFSLRTIEQCFTEINLILRTSWTTQFTLYSSLLACFVALKATRNDLFQDLVQKKSINTVKEIKDHFFNMRHEQKSDIFLRWDRIEIFLLKHILDEDKLIEYLNQEYKNSNDPDIQAHFSRLMEINSNLVNIQPNSVSDLLNRINIASEFSTSLEIANKNV